jgi:hypothetical protein
LSAQQLKFIDRWRYLEADEEGGNDRVMLDQLTKALGRR